MATIVIFVLSIVFPDALLRSLLPYLSITSLVMAYPSCSKTGKLLTSIFVVGGFLLLFSKYDNFFETINSFGSMLNLLSLFTSVPLLALPIRVGNYRDTVERFLRDHPMRPQYFQIVISALSYFMSILMNVGTIPMVYSMMAVPGEGNEPEDSNHLIIPSIVSGYAMPLLWSPVAAVLAAVVSETHVLWIQIFPITFLLSLMGLGLGVFFRYRGPGDITFFAGRSGHVKISTKRELSGPDDQRVVTGDGMLEENGDDTPLGGLWGIGIGIAVFVVSMMLLQNVFRWPIGAIIALLSLPFSLGWSIIIRRRQGFIRELAWYRTAVADLGTTFAVFTGAGFFVTALESSKYSRVLDRTLLNFSHTAGPITFLAVVPWMILLLGMLGLHPVVSITLLSGILHPSILHLAPIWLSVGLLAGGVSSFILSPFMATLTVAGNVSGEHPNRILRWTSGQGLVFLCFCDLVACIGEMLFKGGLYIHM